MSLQTSIEFPEADVRRFAKALGRLQGDMGKSEASALRTGASRMLASLAASTDVAPKYRDYQDTGRKSRRGTSRYFLVTGKHPSWQKEIPAKSVAALKRRTIVQVWNRGLAKQSWRQAMKGKFRATIREGKPSAMNKSPQRLASGFVDTTFALKGHDKYIRITNRVSYMHHALQAGRKSVNMALARASRAIEGQIEKALGKKLDKQLGFKF